MTKRLYEHVDYEEFIEQVVSELRAIDRTYVDRIGIADRMLRRLERERDADHPDFTILWSLRIQRIRMYREALQECLREQIMQCPL